MANEIRQQPTGIKGLDETLGGGLPVGSTILITGAAGSGKTVLAQQWLFYGWKECGEPGLYLSLTELLSKSLKNVRQFSFFDEHAVSPVRVHMSDVRTLMEGLKLDKKGELSLDDLDKLLGVIVNIVKEMGAKRVVLDSVTALLYRIRDRDVMRSFIFRMNREISKLDATIILISEAGPEKYSVFGVEEFISDGIIRLSSEAGAQSIVRKAVIVKMRGIGYRSGTVSFEITSDGICIYPKIRVNRDIASTDFNKRVSTGINTLDEMLDGGIPEGHGILMAGNTGSGKTTMAMEFVQDGLENGEQVTYLALEESPTQIIKTAAGHGWDFAQAVEKGTLSFIAPSSIDIYIDQVLTDIVEAVKQAHTKRFVIDSVSSLESAQVDKNKVREFLLQLRDVLKSNGITSVMTYLSDDMFGAASGQLLGGGSSSELRLSSIVDGILLLRYVERDQTVYKLINILKMRGSKHDRRIREFNIEKDGIIIGEIFKG